MFFKILLKLLCMPLYLVAIVLFATGVILIILSAFISKLCSVFIDEE